MLSKASISRRQRMERAPNKSNSITNVLNAEGEKMFAKLNDKSLKCISPSTIKTEPNIPEASPVHVSTQTAIADPCSLTEVQAVPPFKQIAMPVISEGNQTRVTIDSEDLGEFFKRRLSEIACHLFIFKLKINFRNKF